MAFVDPSMEQESPAIPTTQVQAIFDQIAPVYDALNDRLSLGWHHVWKQMTVDWSGATVGNTCLDLCCGSGDLAKRLAQTVGKTGQVIGLDFSPEQLAIAHQRQQDSYPHLPIHWLQGNALDLPFADNQFDAATMGYGLRNVGDIPRSLQELHRVLKPGSKAAILDFHRPNQSYLQAFQRWYLQTIVVPTARSLNLTDEYAYIQASLDRFPIGSEQVKLAKQAGFTQATHYAIASGLMGVLVVET